MWTGLALERLWCRVTLEPSSVYKKTHTQKLCLLTVWFFLSLHLFYFWWHLAHKPSVTLQLMTLPRNGRFNSWFDWQILHSYGDWQWQVFFLLWLPYLREFCMSKHSCSYVIIVPWNNTKKRFLLSILFYAEKALVSLYICTGSPEFFITVLNITC